MPPLAVRDCLAALQRGRVAEASERLAEQWRVAFRAFRDLGQEQRRAKSVELASVSVQPSPARVAAVVLPIVGAGPPPS